ncbi:MAG: flagellar brake protein [Lachnospiraceae bacterium]|nr:flagellar brake protein [Lachnospiraceae bacterium]
MARGLTIGQKITLTKYTGKLKEIAGARTLVGQLTEVKDDDTLVIAMPMEEKMVFLDIGERYNMFFHAKEELYYCIAQVSDRYCLEQLFLAEMECASEIEKFQCRQFFRLNCIIDMYYRPMAREGELAEDIKAATIVDISGGGARFNAEEAFLPGEELGISFALLLGESKREFQLRAKVIASADLKNRKKIYENRVEFTNISEADREIIVKYVFEEERRRKREGSR